MLWLLQPLPVDCILAGLPTTRQLCCVKEPVLCDCVLDKGIALSQCMLEWMDEENDNLERLLLLAITAALC